MRNTYLILTAGFFALWLILVFWPLSTGSQIALCLLVILVCGLVLLREWRVSRRHSAKALNMASCPLPPEDFQGAVILACGDSAALFEPETHYRETHQGWYLKVNHAEQLPLLAQHMSFARPALMPQISILLAVLPERHHTLDSFTQSIRTWHRAIVQCRLWLKISPPLWTVTWASPPESCALAEPVWLSAVNHRTGVRVHQAGQENRQHADENNENDRLCQTLWLDALLGWQGNTLAPLLTNPYGELPALKPCVQGFCLAPVTGLSGSLWQQHIASITTLSPDSTEYFAERLPLPEQLLSSLPQHRGISRQMIFWRYMGLIGGIFFALAMLASFLNNQRLIRSVGDHLAFYQRLSSESSAPKLHAQQLLLRADARLLDDWQRRGEPPGYRLGLYQGRRLMILVEAAISDWASPVSALPVTEKTLPDLKMVRLNAMSLFDSGKAELKAGSTRMLVNSLMGIKARPGWLIVVAGNTDNTGNPKLNQTLSLKRAEAVRDWMRDTGDVPESCFAVQGHGESRPVATNDTQEGRALNRRVEISLVPQVDACQMPNKKSTLPDTSDAFTQHMEK